MKNYWHPDSKRMSGPANSRVQVKKTCICQLWNITCPILQGGMLWIATAELASAVSNAGGLGVISPLAAMGKDETMSARDAIEMMTLRAAGVCRQEAFKGSISPGNWRT